MTVLSAEEKRSKLEEALSLYAAPEPGSMLVGWVVLGEFMKPDGSKELAFDEASEMTPWQRTGYLQSALNWDLEEA